MTNRTLTERLEYYELNPKDPAYRGISQAIGRFIEGTLDSFYKEVNSRSELAQKFDGKDSMQRARRAQARHWQSTFSEGLDDAFLKRSDHIGGVHAKIGLEPKWYVGSYARILDDMITQMIAPGWKRMLPWKRAEARRVSLLVRVSLLDMDIALSSYFSGVSEKVNSLNEVLGDALAQLAAGKLNINAIELPAEYAKVATDFNSTVTSLHSTVGTVIEGVRAIAAGSSEIQMASDDLARRTEEQAANLEETAAAITQAAQHVRETSATTSKARGTVKQANAKADEGSRIVSEAVTAMDQIEHSSKEITNIISVIDSIAFQTNLLALNAGVEAARAGESGKGFAVVASEVRALAQRCSDAADEVKSLITQTSGHVSSGVDLVKRSGQAFAAITQDVVELTQAIESIADSTDTQTESLSQINTVVGDLDRSTQQNAAMSEQCTAAATSLAQEAANLGATVNEFEVGTNRPEVVGMARERQAPRRQMPKAPSFAKATRGNLALKVAPEAAAAPQAQEDWSEF